MTYERGKSIPSISEREGKATSLCKRQRTSQPAVSSRKSRDTNSGQELLLMPGNGFKLPGQLWVTKE